MSDLQEHRETDPGPPRRVSARTALVAVGVVAVLVAVVVVAVNRAGSTTAGSPSPAGSPSASSAPSGSAGMDASAAQLLGWGQAKIDEEFDRPLGKQWNLYDGPGHNDNGRRSPSAISVADGLLTIKGDAQGTTGGMALYPGHKYGRWEARVRAPASDDTYNAVILLWPDKEDWPVGGEVDFMEMDDPTRQSTQMFLHYGRDNRQDRGEVRIDGTQWHNWAVEWTADHITCYVDGKQWYTTTDRKMFPPRSMHLAIQLDWFPENGNPGAVKPSEMQVDWVKGYPPPGY